MVNDLVDQAENELMRERLKHLSCVTMLPGSFDKRFVSDIWRRDPATLTAKQKAFANGLAVKYRRQMPAHLVPAQTGKGV